MQEILLEDRRLLAAFRESGRLVSSHWLHALRVGGFLWLISIALGPVIGFALIFTNFPLFWINVIGSVIYALLTGSKVRQWRA